VWPGSQKAGVIGAILLIVEARSLEETIMIAKMTKNMSTRDRYLMDVARERDEVDVNGEETEAEAGEGKVTMGRGAKIFLFVVGAALGYVGVAAIVFSLATMVR
jgi:hypothetical protein